MSTVEEKSVCIPGCRCCTLDFQRLFRAREGRAAQITSTAGKQLQKTGKELQLIWGLSYHLCIFNYMFVNEMSF